MDLSTIATFVVAVLLISASPGPAVALILRRAALRGFRGRRGAALSLMQVSVYANDIFVGTLARNAAGAFVSSVDPWFRDDLFNYSGESRDVGLKRQYRLLDAIYSTAARNKSSET